jgi:hypothetical protein
MADNVHFEGLNEVIRDFENAQDLIRDESEDFMEILGGWTATRARNYIRGAGAVDLGELERGVHQVTKRTRSGIETVVRPSDFADNYAIFVERGTKPHRPPVSALQGWADRHGIPVWAVVRKIERDGTEPRWMWRNTFADLLKECDKRLRKFAKTIVRKI